MHFVINRIAINHQGNSYWLRYNKMPVVAFNTDRTCNSVKWFTMQLLRCWSTSISLEPLTQCHLGSEAVMLIGYFRDLPLILYWVLPLNRSRAEGSYFIDDKSALRHLGVARLLFTRSNVIWLSLRPHKHWRKRYVLSLPKERHRLIWSKCYIFSVNIPLN